MCAGIYGCVWGRGREWRPAAPVCCLPPHDRARSKSRVTARKQLRSQEGFILGRRQVATRQSRKAFESAQASPARRSEPPPSPPVELLGTVVWRRERDAAWGSEPSLLPVRRRSAEHTPTRQA